MDMLWLKCVSREDKLIFYVIVFTMSLPFQITLIPNYITMVNLHLVDTFLALVLRLQ